MEQKPISGHCPVCTGQKEDTRGLWNYPLAMVYAPVQTFRGLYDARTALCRGTLFSELDLPLEAVCRTGGRGTQGCGCRRPGREE